MLRIYAIIFYFFFMPLSASASTPEESTTTLKNVVLDGQTLRLNGSGFRSVFIMDIYQLSLYLPRLSRDVDSIIQYARPAQLRLVFLHGGVGHDMLARGWRKGFERNQTADMMIRLEERLKQFSDLFGAIHKGDEFVVDFLSNNDTRIGCNGQVQSIIHGSDFQHALLAVWLGTHPVQNSLKKALLQMSER